SLIWNNPEAIDQAFLESIRRTHQKPWFRMKNASVPWNKAAINIDNDPNWGNNGNRGEHDLTPAVVKYFNRKGLIPVSSGERIRHVYEQALVKNVPKDWSLWGVYFNADAAARWKMLQALLDYQSGGQDLKRILV